MSPSRREVVNPNSTSTSTYILELQPRRHVTWEEDVVDNEHMNKKSSKRCCIFHKAKEFGESSSESEDSISSDSEEEDPQAEGDNQQSSNEIKELDSGKKMLSEEEIARKRKEKEKRRREREKRRKLKIHQRNHA